MAEIELFNVLLLNNLPSPILLTDLDGSIKYINAALEKLTGFNSAELIGTKAPFPWWYPEDNYLPELRERTFENAEVLQVERIFRKKSGEPFWVVINTTRVGIGGQPDYYLSSWVDITELKKTRNAIWELDALNKSILEHAPNPIVMHNKEFSIEYVNPAFEAFTGFTAAEVVGKKPPYPYWPEEMKEGYTGEIGKNDPKHRIFDRYFKKKNGESIWVELTTAPIKDGTGKLIHSLSIWTDVTSRRKAEEQTRYQAMLVDSVSDAIISSDLQSHIISWNKAAESIYGWKEREVLGKRVPDILQFTFPDTTITKLVEQLNQTGRWIGESIQKRKDGSHLSVSGSVSRIKDSSGKFIGNVGIYRDITEQKRAEESLKQLNTFNASILDKSSNPIMIINPDTSIRFVNPAFENLTGFTAAELTGAKPPYPYWPPEKADEYLLHYEMNYSRPMPETAVDRYYIKKTGEPLWAEITTTMVKDESGKLIYVIIIWTDVTERRKAEEQAKYQATLMENLSEAIISTDLDTFIISWNRAAENIYGWKQEEVLGENIGEVLHGEALTGRKRSSLYKQLDDTGTWKGESLHRRRDGSLLNVFASICRIKDSSGKATGMVAIYRDITEQKKAEGVLKESEAKFRALAEQSSNMILIYSGSHIVYANQKCVDITGHSREDLYSEGFDYTKLMVPESKELALADFNRKGNDINLAPREYKIFAKDGQRMTVVISVTEIEYEKEKAYLATVNDITEHKMLEEQLRGLYETEKKQREELEEEARARGMFINVLAHELRTPFTPILASSGMLKDLSDTSGDELVKKLVNNVYSGSQTLARRLEELLDLARHSRGTFKLSVKPTDLNKLFQDVISRFRPSLESSKQKLVEEIDGSLPEADIDASRLEQVILNLLSNASKFSPENGTLSIKAKVEGKNLRVDVEDSGIGISLDAQESLFKPYHRVEQDRLLYPGLGLGLAIAKNIVEAHGGKIWLVSEPARGSTFSFKVPLKSNHTPHG